MSTNVQPSASLPLYNPYDFANPVTQRKLFSGRKPELDEILYYLNHALNAPRPISLALIGNRASGKTSLLNITEQEAQHRQYCTVRIDLDQSHAENELSFFSKFFHSIFFSTLSDGVFEGFNGKTYETYLDMVTANKVPKKKTFCPFLFPIQYAKASAANRDSVELLDESIKHDMKKIQAELNKPIVILLDECDVLINSPPILQKLRNILMQLEGYMVVMAATPNLFPLLDDVFSPIIRQLKRISIQEFKSSDDSRKCIERPLTQVGLDPSRVLGAETYDEIHHLSGGRPYEINLICHVLFRRYQENPRKPMSLNATVLEDIRSELDKSQDLSHRMVLQTIRDLSKSDLQAFSLLCRANSSLTLEQLTCIERIFFQESRFTTEELSQVFSNLVSKEVLGTDSHCRIVFLGDEFERIYTKYFAKELGTFLRIDEDAPAVIWTRYESGLFRRNGVALRPISTLESARRDSTNIVDIVENFRDPSEVNVFDKYRWLASDIYWALAQDEGGEEISVLQLEVGFEWLSNLSWFHVRAPAGPAMRDTVGTICERLKSSVITEGGILAWRLVHVSTPSLESMVTVVEKIQDDVIRSHVAHLHLSQAIRRYLEEKSQVAALWHARFCSRVVHRVDFGCSELNNLGYIFLSGGEYGEADRLLSLAVSASVNESGRDRLLPRYNLALTRLVSGETSSARELLTEVAAGLGEAALTRERLACLLYPVVQDDSILLKEELSPDFDEIVHDALRKLGIS